MKISRIKIKNLFGIKEYEADGKDVELIGKNAVGKTSIIDAIKYALTNKADRQYLIREGELEGEVLIEFDSGLRINRKPRTNKTDYKSIKQDKTEKTEGFLREIFTELQLNPIEFAKMSEQEQNRIILDMIDFKWDLKWIEEQFGEIPAGVNYQQNILNVLHEIQSDKGAYFLKREEVNRDRRNKQAFIEEIGNSLPKGYQADKWERADLGGVYTKIEGIRASNSRILEAKGLINESALMIATALSNFNAERQRLHSAEKDKLQSVKDKIAELARQMELLQAEIPNITLNYSNLQKLAEQKYIADTAALDSIIKCNEEIAKSEVFDFSDLQGEAGQIEAMKGYIKEYNRMVFLQQEVLGLTNLSESLTGKIEKARALPGMILANSKVPIEGLTIKDGIPLINGLPISNLSEGEKFELCINVATKNPAGLQMLLIDGIEKLATTKRTKVYADLKKKGVQFIATRTTDDDCLTVIEL